MIKYREIRDPEELKILVELQAVVWQTDLAGASPHNMLMAIIHHSGFIIGAFDGKRIIGFTLALLARYGDALGMWSHMAGVHPDYQRQGIGFRLKQEQRLWCLQHGYDVMKWTFDPLQRGNANFNLRQLGAYGDTYHINFYGEMPDGINAGMPSDRLEIVWSLNDERVQAAAQGDFQPVTDAYQQESFLLRVGADGAPIHKPLNPTAEFHFAEIPYNINALKKQDIAAARTWQAALGRVLRHCLAVGYLIVDFVIRDGRCWYVLRRKI